MPRFYIDQPIEINQHIPLPENISRHWLKVLRAKIGDQAIFFNGLGGEYCVELTDISKNSAAALALTFNPENRSNRYQVTLGQVMSKGDRMDYVVQKATELGVHSIQLLNSERCEMRLKYDRDLKKIQHWQNIAIAACEQCGLNQVPQILAPIELATWAKQVKSELKLILNPTATAYTLAAEATEHISLLVGPEGGFSDQEISDMTALGFHSWQLGSRILRTETAPIVALSALLYHFQA